MVSLVIAVVSTIFHHESTEGGFCGACVGMGVGAAGVELRRGLKTRTRTSAKIMSKRRKMHFRLPVFFWYLSSTGTRNRKGDEGEKRSINQTLIAISNT